MNEPQRYAAFDREEVRGLAPQPRAEFHAKQAEWLLDGLREAAYVITPVAVSTALTHAQLATAWALIAQGDTTP